jgi:hypothetical protein
MLIPFIRSNDSDGETVLQIEISENLKMLKSNNRTKENVIHESWLLI